MADQAQHSPRDRITTLHVKMGDQTARLAVQLDRTLIQRHCNVTDIEIVGFASIEALLPWIRRIEMDRDARIGVNPEPMAIARAISSFTHSGPTFSARLGAIAARIDQSNCEPAIHLSIPDGTQIIRGNQLLSRTTRDHWLAHRPHDLPLAVTTMTSRRGLAVTKFALATLIAGLAPDRTLPTATLPEPETILRAVRTLLPSDSSWPRSPHDSWHATHMAEVTAVAKGWIVEDPCQVGGSVWKVGPNWQDCVTSIPLSAIAYGKRLLDLVIATNEELLETISFVLSEEMGASYLAQRNFGVSGEPSAHDRLYAAPLVEIVDTINDDLAVDLTAKSWFLQPVSA